MPLHKRVFYRGLKHELFAAKQAGAIGESGEEDVDDRQHFAKKLADLNSIWQCPRNASNVSVGKVDEGAVGVNVVLKRGRFNQASAINIGSECYADPELVVASMETGRLAAATGHDGERPLSVFDAHENLYNAGSDMSSSLPFASMFRLGFTVKRFPAVFRVEASHGVPYEDLYRGTIWGPEGSERPQALVGPGAKKRKMMYRDQPGGKKARKDDKQDAGPSSSASLDELLKQPLAVAPPRSQEEPCGPPQSDIPQQRAWWQATDSLCDTRLIQVPESELAAERRCQQRLQGLRPLGPLRNRLDLSSLPGRTDNAKSSLIRDLRLDTSLAQPPALRYEAYKPGAAVSVSALPKPDLRLCVWGNESFPHVAAFLGSHVENQGGALEMMQPTGKAAKKKAAGSDNAFLKHVQVTSGVSWFSIEPASLPFTKT